MLWNNVNWSEVAADMPSAMQNAILTHLSYIGLATNPQQAAIQAREAQIQASLPVPLEQAQQVMQLPDGGMMSDDDFRIMEQRAEWTKAHPQPDYRSTLGK
jgi:hypothetical protein